MAMNSFSQTISSDRIPFCTWKMMREADSIPSILCIHVCAYTAHKLTSASTVMPLLVSQIYLFREDIYIYLRNLCIMAVTVFFFLTQRIHISFVVIPVIVKVFLSRKKGFIYINRIELHICFSPSLSTSPPQTSSS